LIRKRGEVMTREPTPRSSRSSVKGGARAEAAGAPKKAPGVEALEHAKVAALEATLAAERALAAVGGAASALKALGKTKDVGPKATAKKAVQRASDAAKKASIAAKRATKAVERAAVAHRKT
jgi:hypothetical protein